MKLSVLHGRWWLVIGTVFFVGTALSSIVRSLEPMSIGDVVYLSIDWIGACVIYFFIGALVGFFVDRFFTRKIKRLPAFPLWFWFTSILWIGSIILLLLIGAARTTSIFEILFFPLAYGIFFPGIAFSMLLPDLVQKTSWGKLVLDIIFLSVFAAWLYLEIKNRSLLVRRVLLGVIFTVFVLGVVGCAKVLAS